MYPITEAVRALFEADNAKVLRITGSTVKKLPSEISVYNGDELIYQSGDGKHLKLYSGSTEIYDSQDAHVVILYSGTEPIFINDEAGMPIQIEITSDNVRESSFFIDRYSCNGEKLEVGTAIAAEMKLTLDNADGQFDGVVFEGAELFVEVGVADWTQENPTVNWVPCGYFTPDVQPRRLTTITIEALDRMTKFDVVVDAADLTFPATIAGLVSQVCTLCGVTLAQSISGLTNAAVVVSDLPIVQGDITYRNLIQWCAGIMGTNAWFDWNGQLRFSWYNNATGYVSTTDNRYSSDLYEDDLMITGVEYTNDSGIAVVEGTDDYAIDLTGNAIAGPLIATVLPPLNTALNGFTYRPFTAATVNAPYLWPMDVVTFTDKNGNNHTSALTNVAFGLNGTTAMESKGMTYAVNKLAQPKGFTREQAQLVSQAMERVEQDIDDSLTQQDIFNRLTDNGVAQGLVLYNGQLYVNASYINAGYLSAARIKGDTLTLGGANNVNGTMRILDASGNEIGTWTNNGISISAGSIQMSRANGNELVTVSIQQSPNNPLVVEYENTSQHYRTILFGDQLRILDSDNSRYVSISPSSINLTESGVSTFEANAVLKQYGFRDVRVFSVYGQSDDTEPLFRIMDYGDGQPLQPYVEINAPLFLSAPLPVLQGGTGAITAANARANLEITPANIGAAVSGYLGSTGNLDDMHTTGLYYVSGASATGFPQNNGKVYGGVINISNDTGTRTIQIVAGVFLMYIYYRKYVTDEGGWGAWKQVTLT